MFEIPKNFEFSEFAFFQRGYQILSD